MKEYYPIGEFAKLHQTTSETLRHYDRIGLFKPAKIDEETGYRYYHLMQSEKLTTILDLRILDLSTEDIQAYFQDRNMSKSKALLQEQYHGIRKKIKDLKRIEQVLNKKIKFLDGLKDINTFCTVIYKHIPTRYALATISSLELEIGYDYSVAQLLPKLVEPAPLLATNRIGFVSTINKVLSEKWNGATLFIEIDDPLRYKKEILYTIPAGYYACILWKEHYKETASYLEKILEDVKLKGFIPKDTVVNLSHVDESVSDQPHEYIFEQQLLLEKK